jgi:hypothetical protein
VHIAAGTYSGPGNNQRFLVTFNPANSGTAGSPITFKAEGRVQLTLSSSAGPIIGCFQRNYITWDGFYIDEATAPGRADTGPVVVALANNCTLVNLEIKSVYANWIDNHCAIRLEQTYNAVVRNNIIYGVGTINAGGQNERNQNDAGIMTYDTNDSIIENNTIYDSGVGVFIKGRHPGFEQSRNTIRYNMIYNIDVEGVSLLDSRFAKVYQNVIHHSLKALNESGLAGGAESQDDTWQNNTVYAAESGIWFRGNSNLFTRLRFYNNIILNSTAVAVNTEEFSSPGPDTHLEHNVYFGFPNFGWSAGGYKTFATWKSMYGTDQLAPASVNVDPRLVNPAAGDYRLCTGAGQPTSSCTAASPVLSVGVDILDLNGNGSTSDTIRPGAYITGNEIIGRTTPGQSSTSAPSAPAGLHIVSSN